MTNKYDNLRLNAILERIKDKNILTKTADVICRMRENVDCPNFFYIPADCMSDMDYVIAAINYIIVRHIGTVLAMPQLAASIVFICFLRKLIYKKFLRAAL